MSAEPTPLVVADEITYRALYREVLSPTSIRIDPGQCWIVTGANGSGKSLLAEILAGVRAPHSGSIVWPAMPNGPEHDAAVVSFERQERIMERERREDLSSIMHGTLDPGHRVRDLLAEPSTSLAARFGIGQILDRGLRFLSTGEFRKSLLAGAVSRSPRLLVLDEPYDGLDLAARGELSRLIAELHCETRSLLLVLNRRRDFPQTATHLLELDAGRTVYAGEIVGRRGAARTAVRGGGASAETPSVARAMKALARATKARAPATKPSDASEPARAAERPSIPLIRMRNVSLSYGQTPILRDLSWTVHPSDRWMIHGPNGSGKSTLLSLIMGDNPKAYGQEIDLFGRRKGSGESVWEIKRRIGMVSGDLQFRYPLRERVEETVLSGFYDSLGLFEEPTGLQREIAVRWISRAGLDACARARMGELSFGQRRMALIARAMVKHPQLLIADEPCQGLDDEHARQVLALLDEIGHDDGTCLLYVTHNADETLSCITDDLELVPGPEGSRAVMSSAT
ncbi:MAG: ATP-binding cassette domain-containing protein [Spirochaetota bacterium]